MIYNPRFPHTFTVTRNVLTGTNANPTQSTITVAAGHCRYYPDNGGSEKGGVKVADYKLSTPENVSAVQEGDFISCTNLGLNVTGTVKLCHLFNMGSNIWFNIVKN